MRTILPGWLLLATLLLSCQKPLFPSVGRDARAGGRTAGRTSESSAPDTLASAPAPDIYLTALRFSDDGAQVVLFKNGQECLSVPVEGTPEPERHRVLAGALWTDATDGTQTVVSCNGTERFRHPGAELYRGFLLRGGAVHTLGQRQGWEGLSYRVNGEERFQSPIGTVLGSADDREWPGGAFCQDSSGIYYSFAVPVRTADALLWEYRVMRGAQLLKTVAAGSIQRLYDIRVLDGAVYRSERRAAWTCLVRDEEAAPLRLLADAHLCKLVPLDGRMLVKGYSGGWGNLACTYWLREPDGTVCSAQGPLPGGELLYDGTHTALITRDSADCVAEILLDGCALDVPSGEYRLATPRCATLQQGILGGALSSAAGTHHRVLVDGSATTYSFNGYFTSIVID